MGLSGKLFGNRFLNYSMIISFLILVIIMYVPVLSNLFSVVPLNVSQVLISVGFMLISVVGFEISKLVLKAK